MPTKKNQNEHISESESDLSDNETVNEPEVEVEVVAKKQKPTSLDNYTELFGLFQNLSELDASFTELKKDFEKSEKDYYSDRKRIMREMSQLYKKLSKSLPNDLTKKKKRSGNHSGGFTKKVPVPVKLREYLELEDDVEMTRPEVMSKLNAKFTEEGFRDGKIVTISSGKVAKRLGCSKGFTIEFSGFQSFLKRFYDEEKNLSA